MAPRLAAEAARLAAAEQRCCPFFASTLRLEDGLVRLDVEAPPHAADVVAALLGAA